MLSTLNRLATLEKPVIHRDIKPANVFVKGRACVLGDFGLMKTIDVEDRLSPEDVVKTSVGNGMPFFHRTPDLIAYANGEAAPTVASDVFQLGLVAAELFTGRNPQKRAEHDNFKSRVILEPLRYVPGSRGGMIKTLIHSMLVFDPEKRPAVADLLDQWRDFFFAIAADQEAFEGRVFS